MAAPEVWTIRSMLSWCEGYLGRKGDASPRRSAEVLVGKACGLERLQLYLDMDRPLAPAELDVLREDVRKRGQGMPLQYITGTAPFRYLEVKVAPGVLIPRPETEVLVSEAIAMLPPAPKPQDAYDEALLAALRVRERTEAEAGAAAVGPRNGSAPADGADPTVGREAGDARTGDEGADRVAGTPPAGIAALFPDAGDGALLVADICTGSGCIACSIATEHPNARVIATDLSPQAVALARRNAEAFGVEDRVQVVECDLGAGVPADAMGTFDLVVSNPPYIPTGVLAGIPGEVRDFEPELALDGGEDGLDLYRRLLVWAHGALKPGGGFACELHETCLDIAAQLASAEGFAPVRIVDDLAGRPRVLVARMPPAHADDAPAQAPAACWG